MFAVVLAGAGCGAAAGGEVALRSAEDATSTTVTVPESATSSTTAPPTTSDSTSTSSSSTPTSTTTLPPAAKRHIVGTHAGVEHFAFGTGRCPFLDHQLDEVFTLADGTAWRFSSAYCGTADANNVWSGFGTFTFTAPDGTLFGRSTSRAQLPTTGVPYRLDVDGGTGAFAGTTGVCVVEEHLQQQSFGVQEHSGAFTCDLSAPGLSAVGR